MIWPIWALKFGARALVMKGLPYKYLNPPLPCEQGESSFLTVQNKTKRYKDEHFISKLRQLCRQQCNQLTILNLVTKPATEQKELSFIINITLFLLIENKTWSKRWIAAYTFTPMQAF